MVAMQSWEIKASSDIVFGLVFDGIQQYCNTLAQPYGKFQIKFWIPANTFNTTEYCQILPNTIWELA